MRPPSIGIEATSVQFPPLPQAKECHTAPNELSNGAAHHKEALAIHAAVQHFFGLWGLCSAKRAYMPESVWLICDSIFKFVELRIFSRINKLHSNPFLHIHTYPEL